MENKLKTQNVFTPILQTVTKQGRNSQKTDRLYVITIHFFKTLQILQSVQISLFPAVVQREHTHPHTTCFNCVTKWETLKNGAILSKSWIRTVCLINLREKRTRVKQTSYSCRKKKRLFRLSPAPSPFKNLFCFLYCLTYRYFTNNMTN